MISTPSELVRKYWTDQPYWKYLLPGERGRCQLLLPHLARLPRTCARMAPCYVCDAPPPPSDVRPTDAAAHLAQMHGLVTENVAMAQTKFAYLSPLWKWLLTEHKVQTTPVAIWPSGYDWDMPFTVGGSIVWPQHFLRVAPESAAKTYLHELVHVAQFHALYGQSGDQEALRPFMQWIENTIAEPKEYTKIEDQRRAAVPCTWLQGYLAGNSEFSKYTRAGGDPLPDWWTYGMQNPDWLGVVYRVRYQDELYLPWMVSLPNGGKIETWLLPLHADGHVTLDRPIIKDQARLRTHFGCHQFDHPHEIAAHWVADLVFG